MESKRFQAPSISNTLDGYGTINTIVLWAELYMLDRQQAG